jgi:hypothetical protein
MFVGRFNLLIHGKKLYKYLKFIFTLYHFGAFINLYWNIIEKKLNYLEIFYQNIKRTTSELYFNSVG